ncbi:efflux RND transporter periplasmic adaptor subunit [Arundinibacter roseus]|uniref:Efflux RND transporter periplasmic adaptor subunit n=1 Tax=Arundinibacter roseus TaxID=2070510 RepID=A0A4R4KCR6_9BACT|nr:efflux RND transporter periplasmic adaptor subunit [Arundinibacter roseus]TDB64079.1 efflux RND transporter periplasmic adaptor subunit [Arundinibacter roseus]
MKSIVLPSIFLLSWVLAACSEKEAQQTKVTDEEFIAIKTVSVRDTIRVEPVLVSGRVASSEEARLSFKIGGIVSQILVKEGQAVRKGQLLAVLDQTEISAQVKQAQFSAEKAERDRNRVEQMLRDTAATLEQMQNASTGYDVANQSLQIARFNQAYSRITSPIDGTVTRKFMNEGELASSGAPVLLLASNRRSDWVVRVGVSDKDWARLAPGDQATIELDAYPDEIFKGKVTTMAQAADPLSSLYEVEIRLDNSDKRLATGLFATVTLLPRQSRSYAVVPIEAIVEGNGKNAFVFVNAQGKARRIPVVVGFLDGKNVLIRSGLDGVSQVITAGSGFLRDGSRIQ